MKYKINDVVQVRSAGSNKPAKGNENLWELVATPIGTYCVIRNKYDEYRANQDNKHTAAQEFDTSALLPWKGKLPIQFR
jgi:hypothetical protein